jgi:2-polyprenyl-3-methyl-5-hydroxy-6-metoxy-1,4-benzoquinol methylase
MTGPEGNTMATAQKIDKAAAGATIPCPLCGSPSSFMADHPHARLYRCTACTHAFSQIEAKDQESYQANYFYEDHRRWFENPNFGLFDRIVKNIPQGASVLDAGCGRGDMLRYFHKVRPDLKLAGVDLSENKDSEGIRYYHGDIITMDIKERFDAVITLAVIEHVYDVPAFVDRLTALTKPGGTIAVMTLNDDSLLYILARMGKKAGMPLAFNRVYSRHHLHHFTRKSLRHALESRGLKIEAEIDHNVPMAAVDVPVKNPVAGIILRAGVWGVFVLGRLTGKSYLQTIFCRKPG